MATTTVLSKAPPNGNQGYIPMTFEQPQDLQLNSRLARLPAEIRLIILRSLLTFPRCDGNDESQLVIIREHLRRGVQLMQTCQLLYSEGSTVLFTENILCYNLGGDSAMDIGELQCPILGVLHAAHDITGNSISDGRLEWDATLHDCYNSWSGPWSNRNYLRDMELKDLLSVVQQFQKFEWTLIPEAHSGLGADLIEEVIFVMSRLFRDVLVGKCLTISSGVLGAEQVSDMKYTLLDGCRFLHSLNLTIPKPLKTSYELSKHIANPLPVQDTYKQWLCFRDCVTDMLPAMPVDGRPGDERRFEEIHRVDLRLLELHARHYDVDLYLYTLEEVIQHVNQWKATWWELRSGELISVVKAIRACSNVYYRDVELVTETKIDAEFETDKLTEVCRNQKEPTSEVE